MNETDISKSNQFRPSGAILFFGLLILIAALMWFIFYYIMIVKGS